MGENIYAKQNNGQEVNLQNIQTAQLHYTKTK